MNTQDFLVELGLEEIPPNSLFSLSKAFLKEMELALKTSRLDYGSIEKYSTPRRLAIIVKMLDIRQPNKSITVWGPSIELAYDIEGNLTPAALGFSRKHGISFEKITNNGSKIYFKKVSDGKLASELMPDIIRTSLKALPIPKRMHWGMCEQSFIRPIQWLIMLLGNEVVNCTILGKKSGRYSKGHRFHSSGDIYIESPESYRNSLKDAHVIANFEERLDAISDDIARLAKKEKAVVLDNPSLINEVTSLVEWPCALVCSFDKSFLKLPQESLIFTMQDNQKYFCLRDKISGSLINKFITIVNINSTDPEQIILGNEKVIRARLEDIDFFIKKDRKRSLEEFSPFLKGITFQAKLGSMFDRSKRISRLAAFIASSLGEGMEKSARAGLLSKCDLASEIVNSFPEMQGIAGYYHALEDGEPLEIAKAIYEQYMPCRANPGTPSTRTGVSLSIAEKIDTLVGIFGVSIPSNGSKDPYALRRSALNIIYILIDKEIHLDLEETIHFSIETFGKKVESSGLKTKVFDFIFDRLRSHYENKEINIRTYLAVRTVEPLSVFDFNQRVKAIEYFCQLPEINSLLKANKRIANFVSKMNKISMREVEPRYFDASSEFSLYSALQKSEGTIQDLVFSFEYHKTLLNLAYLSETVNIFFDTVKINVDDETIRNNRYILLSRLRKIYLSIADLSLLSL